MGSLVRDGEWPPHTSTILVELLDDDAVRVSYQFETVLTRSLDEFLALLRPVALSEAAHVQVCGQMTPGTGTVFRWN